MADRAREPWPEDLYMLHTAEDSDAAHNSAEPLIANLKGGSDGAYFKVVASADGSFSVTNTRTGQTKTYRAQIDASTSRDKRSRLNISRSTR